MNFWRRFSDYGLAGVISATLISGAARFTAVQYAVVRDADICCGTHWKLPEFNSLVAKLNLWGWFIPIALLALSIFAPLCDGRTEEIFSSAINKRLSGLAIASILFFAVSLIHLQRYPLKYSFCGACGAISP
ncbi:hypothetical protein EON80_13780 [bacterium]|nr:MAG: hypothetical protein EON80_13780 [bacterium]